MNLRTTYKIKRKNTFDTDKYEMHFRVMPPDSLCKSVWEADTYVGPESYNHGHIDNILSNQKNDADTVTDDNNPFFFNRGLLSKNRIKFEP